MPEALRAVVFDVDFTIGKPGPLLGGEGYRFAGRRYGLELDAARYDLARAAAVDDLQHHPELVHDESVWIRFTEDIVRGMGGDGPAVSALAIEIVHAWERSENFELYEDVPPVLRELTSPLFSWLEPAGGGAVGIFFGLALLALMFLLPGGFVSGVRRIRDRLVTVVPKPPVSASDRTSAGTPCRTDA